MSVREILFREFLVIIIQNNQRVDQDHKISTLHYKLMFYPVSLFLLTEDIKVINQRMNE